MASLALSGDDTVVIQQRNIVDLATGDYAEVTFPNGVADLKTGKNGNSIVGFNYSGLQCEFKLMLIRGSADDQFFQNLLSQFIANPAGFVLLSGNFVKNLGDGAGNIIQDTYVLSSGIFIKIPEMKSNAEGETNQSMSTFTMKFANAVRVLT